MRHKSLLAGTLICLGVSAAAQDTADAMGHEALLETAPESLRAANHILSRTFDRGVKDMDAYAYLAKLLLQHTLNLAERHPAQALDYKRTALPIAYNLAANTWPGWGTPDGAVPVRDHHRRLGLEAARLDAALAAEVAPTAERRFNSHWILGAHLIADGAYADAVAAFEAGRTLAAEANLEQSATMAQGWIHLANTLAGTDETAPLALIEAKLIEQGGDGPFFARQYAAAYAVFGGTSP